MILKLKRLSTYKIWVVEMAPLLRALAVFPDNHGPVQHLGFTAHNCLVTPVPGNLMSSSVPITSYAHGTDINTGKIPKCRE